MFKLGLLIVGLVVSASAGPLQLKGRENVFDYTVSIGKELEGHDFDQGFAIASKVIARQRTDGSWNIRFTDLVVRCHKNEAIDKSKYAELETLLSVPFDFNPASQDLTIYAPELTNSESVNLKRGLVNLLEVWDSESNQFVRLSDSGSSGKCQELTSNGAEESNRITDSATNCTSALPHEVVSQQRVSSWSTYCDAPPRTRRSSNVHVHRSAAGAAPKLEVTLTERIALTSSLPNGLLDTVLGKAELNLLEVRDGTEVNWIPGASANTKSEVNLHVSQVQHDQAKHLAKATGAFAHLGHCLEQFEKGDHLEELDLPDTIIGLTWVLRELDVASLNTLYASIEGPHKDVAFFQILGLVGTDATFHVVSDIYEKAAQDSSNAYKLGEALAGYFERLDIKSRRLGYKTGKEIGNFFRKIAASDKTHPRLKTASVLAAAAIYGENCVKNQDPTCPPGADLVKRMSETDPSLASDEMTLIKIKAIANGQLKEGFPLLKAIISDKTKPIHQRTQAAWALIRLLRVEPQVRQFALDLFFDRTEDHEVRIAAYVISAKSGSSNDLSSLVSYVVDNADEEDDQVVHYVLASVKAFHKMSVPTGSKCPSWGDVPEHLWDNVVSKIYEKHGPQSTFDSSVYYVQGPNNKESILVSIIASKTDFVPRSIYISGRDQFQHKVHMINIASNAVVYNNLAKLKAAFDQMRQVKKTVNEDVKTQLAAVLDGVEAAKAPNTDFSLLYGEQVDNRDTFFERFTKPEQILHRVLARSVSADRYMRSFQKYNDVHVKTNTESGLRVVFAASQIAVTSLEVPQFTLGKMGRTGLPVSFRYGYKLISRSYYATVALLPDSAFRYATGRITEKGLAIPRNVTMNVMRKSVDDLQVSTIKIRSDPLRGAESKDVLYRSLIPFCGNMMDMLEYKKLLVRESDLEKKDLFHGYLGFGMTVEKTRGYWRPNILTTPLTRWSRKYQEIDDEVKPFSWKVSISKNPDASASSEYGSQVNFARGVKDGHFIGLMGVTIDDPVNAGKKSMRLELGLGVNADNPNKRRISIVVENMVKKVTMRAHHCFELSDNALAVPRLLKGNEWADAYATEKVIVENEYKWSPTGRSDFDLPATISDILGDIADPDAKGRSEYYRTEEQINLYSSRANTVEGDAGAVGGRDLYSRLIANSHKHAKDNFAAWWKILSFHGVKAEVEYLRPIPDAIHMLHHRILSLLTAKHYRHTSYDLDNKAEAGKVYVSSNSTVDNSRTDLVIRDKHGETKIMGFKSKIIPLLRPSSSPIFVFQKLRGLNLPTCTLSTSAERSEIETFDGKDISADELKDGCSYLLTGNCRGKRTFAISYTKSDNTYTILYNDELKIVVTETGFIVNGEAQAKKEGLVARFGETILASYKGLLHVYLPNAVRFIREKNSSTSYTQTSRLHRSLLCGLCGDLNGDITNDGANNLDNTSTCAR